MQEYPELWDKKAKIIKIKIKIKSFGKAKTPFAGYESIANRRVRSWLPLWRYCLWLFHAQLLLHPDKKPDWYRKMMSVSFRAVALAIAYREQWRALGLAGHARLYASFWVQQDAQEGCALKLYLMVGEAIFWIPSQADVDTKYKRLLTSYSVINGHRSGCTDLPGQPDELEATFLLHFVIPKGSSRWLCLLHIP